MARAGINIHDLVGKAAFVPARQCWARCPCGKQRIGPLRGQTDAADGDRTGALRPCRGKQIADRRGCRRFPSRALNTANLRIFKPRMDANERQSLRPTRSRSFLPLHIRHAQKPPRDGVLWRQSSQLRRAIEIGDRSLKIILCPFGEAALVVSFVVLRIEFDGAAEIGDGSFDIAL